MAAATDDARSDGGATGRPATTGAWTEPALRVLRERYLVKDATGEVVETPEQMCWRVATTIAGAERQWGLDDQGVVALARSFYDLMVGRTFLPNSPTLMNAGRGSGLQYSACYVLPVGDSMEEIFDAVKAAAVIQKSGGGTGMSFSRLRQKDAIVGSTGGRSSGPVSFLRVFNAATEAVKQGGTRRGANMGVLRVDHPDIVEFIDAKREGGIENFNVSVAVTDLFMEALAEGGDYDLVAPHSREVVGRLPARDVWNRIAQAAWETGDPGVIFLDRINASPANPTPDLGLIEATNPCIAGDAWVYTTRGLVRIRELAQEVEAPEVVIDSRFERGDSVRAERVVSRGRHPVFRLRSVEGYELRLTDEHRVMTSKGFKAAKHLVPGDELHLLPRPGEVAHREPFVARFLALEPDGEDDVYDVVEPTTRSFVANGFVVHNCGEQPLAPNDACNLGSINVSALVRQAADGSWAVDWAELERVVRLAVRFLDDVIDVNPYPLPEIDRVVKANRRIGLGIMGWADLLFRIGIPYDSEEALALAERLMGAIQKAGHEESARLAVQRGAFPSFSQSIYRGRTPLRNSTVTTIAPTGTISMIAGCSSGIEPAFALAFTHTVGTRRLTFVDPVFEDVARERGFSSDVLLESVGRTGTLRGVDGVPEEVKRVFVTAHEVDATWHVRHQAAFQNHTDNGVSKTINLPHDATVADVQRAYDLAWELGCLGITVFRDGSKPGVLKAGVAKAEAAKAAPKAGEPPPSTRVLEPRPPSLPGRTHRVETPLGTAFVVVNEDEDGEPFEVFVSVGKAGSDTMAVAEAIGRLVSLALRVPSPVPRTQRLREIVEQLSGIGGSRPLGFGPQRVLSLPDGIARALARHLGTHAEGPGDLCPECGNFALAREEGCTSCRVCGFSEC